MSAVSENSYKYGREDQRASENEIVEGKGGNERGQKNEDSAEEKMSAVAFCKIQFEAFFLFLGKCFFAEVMLGQSVSLFEHGVYVFCNFCLDIQAGTELFRFGGKLSAEDTFLFSVFARTTAAASSPSAGRTVNRGK